MISVLYVDDEPDLLELAKIFLQTKGDFQVDLLTSAAAALEHLQTYRYDAIVADYQMPVMDGLEFLKQVRLHYGQIPFILFTGKGREEVVILALNSGADFYIQKGGAPQVQFAELAHKIQQAVQRRRAELALEESERRYRDVVEAQTEFISRFRPDGTHVFANEAYCRFFGKRHEEIVGHRFIPTIPGKDQETVTQHLASLTPDHPAGDIEHRVIMADGSVRWNWWNHHAFFDDAGKVIEYQSVGKDITERKQSEEALRIAQEKYTKAFLSAPDSITISELESGTFIEVNDAATTLFGYTRDELIGKSALDLGIWMDKESRDHFVDQIKKEGRIEQFELYERRKSGELYHASITGDTITIGPTRYLIAITRDITREKQMEDALRESEEKFRVLADNAPVAIVMYQGSKIIYVNNYATQVIGYSKEELYTINFWDILHPDSQKTAKERGLARQRGEKVPSRYEVKYVTKSREIRWADLSAGVTHYGGESAAIIMIVDITERKKAEEELRAANEEFRAQFDALQESQQRIQQSEQDYRNILRNIQDVYYRSDTDGNLMLASPSWARLLGYDTVEECYGKNIAKTFYYNPAEREKFLAELYSKGSVTDYRVTLKKRDGTPVPVTTSSHQYFDFSGTFRGVEGTFRDMTDRERAERELRESEEKFRALVEHSLEGILITDFTGKLLFINQTAGRIVDVKDFHAMIGVKNVMEYVAPESQPEVLRDFSRVAQGIDAYLVHYKLITETNREVWVECIGKKIPFGNSTAILVSMRDVTGRRQADDAMCGSKK